MVFSKGKEIIIIPRYYCFTLVRYLTVTKVVYGIHNIMYSQKFRVQLTLFAGAAVTLTVRYKRAVLSARLMSVLALKHEANVAGKSWVDSLHRWSSVTCNMQLLLYRILIISVYFCRCSDGRRHYTRFIRSSMHRTLYRLFDFFWSKVLIISEYSD